MFRIFLTLLESVLKILKNKRNVTNLAYVFVPRFHITRKNFPGYWSNSCTVIASIFFQKWYFEKRKKNFKHSYGFWKINKFIWNEKRMGYLIIQWTILSFTNLLITFWNYIMKNKCFWILWYGWFFQIFVISRNTEIFIETNYWLKMYEPYIFLKANWIIKLWFQKGKDKKNSKTRGTSYIFSNLFKWQNPIFSIRSAVRCSRTFEWALLTLHYLRFKRQSCWPRVEVKVDVDSEV